jgi:2-keto-3-deoxy-L-rhamnonate aldolase RhmA
MYPTPNRTKQKLRDGGIVLGVFIGIPAPRLVELCGVAGYDYVVIDAEHGPIDFGVAEDMIRAADATGITPIVRVPDHLPKTILRYLDAGAQGIMAPAVNTVAAAKAIIEAVKYAPVGMRGLGPGRAAAYGQRGPLSEYARDANDQTLIIVQLEHADALKDIKALVRVDGIDAFEIGLADLSQSLGFPGETSRPEVQEVARRFVAEVLAAGSVIGDSVGSPAGAEDLIKQGYRMIDCGIVGMAMKGLRELKAHVDTLEPVRQA